MGDQVENAERIAAHANSHEHVTELRTGRIGDDALDVVCTRPTVAAKKAVVAPTMATTVRRPGPARTAATGAPP